MEYLTIPFTLGQGISTEIFASMGELPENNFRGMASVFNGVIDGWVPTTIHAGAFTKTLQEKGRGVKILWQHDASEPVGVPVNMVETDQGLAVEGKISLTSRGRDALQLLRDGVVDALSIGFDSIKEELDFTPKGDVQMRHIREVRLWEFSLVTWGADPNAKISEVHSKAAKLEHVGTSPYADLPLLAPETAWDAASAEQRVRAWSGSTQKPNSKYRRSFIWQDGQKQNEFEGYKHQIADIADGTLKVVPSAIFSVAATLFGANGGMDIPEVDRIKIQAHLEQYFAKMREEFGDETIIAPWGDNELAALKFYTEQDALYILGRKLVEGISLKAAKAAFGLIGVVPELPHTPSVDVDSLLMNAELDLVHVEP